MRELSRARAKSWTEMLRLPDRPPSEASQHEDSAFDALLLAPQQGVALIGAFPPYMRNLISAGQPFNVLELDIAKLIPEELPSYVSADRASDPTVPTKQLCAL